MLCSYSLRVANKLPLTNLLLLNMFPLEELMEMAGKLLCIYQPASTTETITATTLWAHLSLAVCRYLVATSLEQTHRVAARKTAPQLQLSAQKCSSGVRKTD